MLSSVRRLSFIAEETLLNNLEQRVTGVCWVIYWYKAFISADDGEKLKV